MTSKLELDHFKEMECVFAIFILINSIYEKSVVIIYIALVGD